MKKLNCNYHERDKSMFSFLKKLLLVLKYIDTILDILIEMLSNINTESNTTNQIKNQQLIAKLKVMKNEIA
jgi:hypothetical protein